MENEKMLIITTKKALKEMIDEVYRSGSDQGKLPDFTTDRLTQYQASKLAGISIPTLKKEIRAGKFKEYSLGKKRYLLKSELLKALRN